MATQLIGDFNALSVDELRGLLSMSGVELIRERVLRRIEFLEARGARQLPAAPVANPHDREKGVEKACDDLLRRCGFTVSRFSQARASRQTPGIPDRYAQHMKMRLRLWIEYKFAGGKPSEDQERWHAAEIAAGGVVLTVWSAEELREELVRLMGGEGA